MTYIHTDTNADMTSGRRVLNLQSTAYTLRQHAISRGGDIEGWRLARKMRDVASLNQVDAIEQEFGSYMRTRHIDWARTA